MFNVGDAPPPQRVQQVGTPESVCTCQQNNNGNPPGSGTPPQKGDAQVAQMQILVWDPPDTEKTDPGAGSSLGPDAVTGGVEDDGSVPGVPMNASFGLGRDETGFNPANLSFSTQLDSADPLNLDNFTLSQPFAAPGSEPVQKIINPPAGISQRLEGLGTQLDMIRSMDGSQLSLIFKNLSSDEVVATHTLQRITGSVGSSDNIPGISYTISKNGQTQTTLSYGLHDNNGGRIWKVVQPDGSISEGSTVITLASRIESLTHKKLVNNVEVILDSSIQNYTTYSFGERLLQSSVTGGQGSTLVTSYAYHDDSSPAPVRGLLKWQINPDGTWRKCEYHPATGRLLRELRPWLSQVANPADATFDNSSATTYLEISPTETWQIDSIAGQVVARRWQKSGRSFFNQVTRATSQAWTTSAWDISLPSELHAGDAAVSDRKLGLALVDTPGLVIEFSYFGGSISRTLSALLGVDVLYDATSGHWQAHAKDVLPTFVVVEGTSMSSQPATITFASWSPESNSIPLAGEKIVISQGAPDAASNVLQFTIPDRLSTDESDADYQARVLAAFTSYLTMNSGTGFTVSAEAGSVTLSTAASGASQMLKVYKAIDTTMDGETTTTYSVGLSSFDTSSMYVSFGRDAGYSWSPTSQPIAFDRKTQLWEISLPSPYDKDVYSEAEKAGFAVASNGYFAGKAALTGTMHEWLSGLVQKNVLYVGNGKWQVASKGVPQPLSLYKLQTPPQALSPAKVVIDCSTLKPSDNIHFLATNAAPGQSNLDTYIAVVDYSNPQFPDHELTPLEIATLIKSNWVGSGSEDDIPLKLTVSEADGTLTVETRIQGSTAHLTVKINENTDQQMIYPANGTNEIIGVWSTVSNAAWHIVNQVGATPDMVPPDLVDVKLFEGWFDTTMTQRFTADYNLWDGTFTLNDITTGNVTSSISSNGLATYYNYDKGTCSIDGQGVASFNWNANGEAIKTTTKRYAFDPYSFELLGSDPVSQVSMSDYQGLTRVEQTWKGTDKVSEVVHDYNTDTRDRTSSKENGTTVYSAVRDTTSNTLTETDSAGTATLTTYTTSGDVASTAKIGAGGRPNIVSTSTDDGFTTTSISSAGGLSRSTSSTRNALGQVVSSIDENGLETTYAYELNGRRTIETRPDTSIRITETYLDGRLKSVTGTGVVPEFHDYVVDSDGNLTETVYLNDDGTGTIRSPRWRSTTTNGLGWVVAEAQPVGSAPGAGVLLTQHTYNVKGQRISTQRSGQKTQLYGYDVFGRQSAQGIDLNNDHQLTVADALTTSQTSYVQQGGNWFEQTVTTETAGTDRSATSRTRTSMRLLGGALYSSAIEYTSDGLVTTVATSTDPSSKTVTTVAATNRSNLLQTRTAVNGLLMTETGKGGTGTISYDYDALERPTVVQDIAGIRRRTVYADLNDGTARSLVSHEDLMPAGDTTYTPQRSYTYHPAGQPGAGQVDTVTQADGYTLSYTYDLLGHQIFVGGTATSPMRYVYDEYGDLWKMHTYREGTPIATSTGDITTWIHDPASGQLMGKTDAQSRGSSQTYDPITGRLYQRTLARRTPSNTPITITYHYDDAGHVSLIDYSDDTPDVTFTYYADGQLKTTSDAAGLHTYAYAGPNGLLSGESVVGGLLDGSSWSTTFETDTNRRDVYTWAWGSMASRSIDYDYDLAGRLGKVSAFGYSATYGYEASTGRKTSLTYSGAGLTGGWHMDTLGRLEYTTWTVGSTQLSRHTYGYNGMHRRTSAQRETGETWRYDYDQRGEVTSAVKRLTSAEDAPAKRGLQFGYGYDLIGNRIMDAQHTPDSGTGLDQVTWTANSLNQITGREQHASRWVFGHVKSPAQLSVTGGGTVIREGDEFTVPVTRSGAATHADWHSLEVSATLPGAGRMENGTAKDVTTQHHGKVWFPASPESLAYDDDGNLIQDGRWTYAWDAENRLVSAATRTDVASATGMPQMRLDFAYDAQSRRVRKTVSDLQPGTGNGAPTWKLTSDLRFLYDGWNLLAEIEMVNPVGFSTQPKASLVRAYAWGTDVSGSMDGAGGVGGLLLVQRAGNVAEAPCYDGNANISAYVRVASGAVTSRHDYDAFGRPIWNELEGTGGRQLAASPFGFSTKYTDAETGWCYYGYRYYYPEIGRWPSRDPIGERGGVNLYGMVGNDPVNRVDILGLEGIEYPNPNPARDRSSGTVASTVTGQQTVAMVNVSEYYPFFNAGVTGDSTIPDPTVPGGLNKKGVSKGCSVWVLLAAKSTRGTTNHFWNDPNRRMPNGYSTTGAGSTPAAPGSGIIFPEDKDYFKGDGKPEDDPPSPKWAYSIAQWIKVSNEGGKWVVKQGKSNQTWSVNSDLSTAGFYTGYGSALAAQFSYRVVDNELRMQYLASGGWSDAGVVTHEGFGYYDNNPPAFRQVIQNNPRGRVTDDMNHGPGTTLKVLVTLRKK